MAHVIRPAPKLALTAALLGLLLSGCTTSEPGVAKPQGSLDAGGGGLAETSAATSTSVSVSLSIDPCELFTVEDLSKYGDFESEYKEGEADRSCHWTERTSGQGLVFALSVRDRQSVETMNDNGAGVQRFEINQRPAAKAKNPQHGNCAVGMKLDDASRIDVAVVDETGDSCQVAEVIAELLEPRLPAVP